MFTPLPRLSRTIRLALASAALPVAVALAAPSASALPDTAPARGPAAAGMPNDANGAMTVIVAEVKGTVQVSTDEGKTWVPAKVEMRLGPGAQFRTGFRSSVTCVIPPDQQFTLESLGTVRVAEAAKQGKRVKTDLVMKYGATNYQIEAAGAEHESTIRTPGSTLSVRGTTVRVTDRPGFAPTAESFTGRAFFRAGRASTYLGRKGGGYARATAAQPDPAQAAINQTVVDPSTSLARTATDARLIAQQTSLGAVTSFDTRQNIAVVSGGAGPLSDAALAASLPGKLDLVLRWTGNANLDLVVLDQPVSPANIAKGHQLASQFPVIASLNLPPANLGQIGIIGPPTVFQAQETLYPGFGLNVSPTGGTIPYDHRGGPNGGMEIAYWVNTPPQGIFGIDALHVSGAPAHFQINAFEDGKPLNLFYLTDPNDPTTLVKTGSYKGTVTGSRNDNAAVTIFGPSNPFYDTYVADAPTAATPSPTSSASSGSSSNGSSAAPAGSSSTPTPAAKPAKKPVQSVARPAPAVRPAPLMPRVSTR